MLYPSSQAGGNSHSLLGRLAFLFYPGLQLVALQCRMKVVIIGILVLYLISKGRLVFHIIPMQNDASVITILVIIQSPRLQLLLYKLPLIPLYFGIL